jgi:hypothetical protein
LVARVRDLLAHDDRVAALDIELRIVASDIFVTGVVTTPTRSKRVERVVHELLPRYRVHNHLDIVEAGAATGSEPVT